MQLLHLCRCKAPLIAVAVWAVASVSAETQPAGDRSRDRFHLRRDAQLRAKLSVEGMNPPVQEVIDRLRDATQLNLTLGESLRYHSPTLGSMQLRDAPAFAVMELLAERQIGDGYWEKTKDGYRLTGKSLALRPPATALTTGKLAALGGGGGLLAALAAAAVVYTRRRAAVRAGGRAEASGPPAEKAPPERRGKPVADGQA